MARIGARGDRRCLRPDGCRVDFPICGPKVREEGPEYCAARSRLTVRVSAAIEVPTAARLAVLWPRLGYKSRSDAIRHAIDVRTLVWDRQLRRDQRIAVQRLIREAEEWAPIDELFARAEQDSRREMGLR